MCGVNTSPLHGAVAGACAAQNTAVHTVGVDTPSSLLSTLLPQIFLPRRPPISPRRLVSVAVRCSRTQGCRLFSAAAALQARASRAEWSSESFHDPAPRSSPSCFVRLGAAVIAYVGRAIRVVVGLVVEPTRRCLRRECPYHRRKVRSDPGPCDSCGPPCRLARTVQ